MIGFHFYFLGSSQGRERIQNPGARIQKEGFAIGSARCLKKDKRSDGIFSED
jgi:hypothetical protein